MTLNLVPIPQPRTRPLIGNLHNLQPSKPVQSLIKLADQYDGIFCLSLAGEEVIVVSSQELVNEICDEKRFCKRVLRPLEKLRDVAGDGLFTAHSHEPNWEKAHRILMPAFGPAAIRNMFPEMLDLAEQLVLKMERQGPDHPVNVSEDMTRLTLDTIALCAFDYRFNSFYKEKQHPFVDAMVRGLAEATRKVGRPELQNQLMFLSKKKYAANLEYLRKVSNELIEERKKQQPSNRKDLLDLMLNAKDPVTGEGLSDENIRYQMLTFLIAGHETTSGMLSFTFHLLLKHPEILKKAQAEVDEVLGNSMPEVEDIFRLTYLDQVLKESLRLYPTAPAFGLQAFEDTVIGGKYPVKAGQTLIVLAPALHREEKVWGSDADAFIPERFSPESYDQLPPNCWKPFGNGSRACIGRPFAMQEALLVLAMVLQRFEISPCDPNYKLRIVETLTLKPEGLMMKVKRRARPITHHQKNRPESRKEQTLLKVNNSPTTPLWVLYGSNSGSSENFARQIAADANRHGYASTLGTLDEYAGKLPKEGGLVIVTASFEGKPADNARHFMEWLESRPEEEVRDIKFAVFGCGNRDWANTYQEVPRKIDRLMNELGGIRLYERGEADASGDFFGDFEAWYESFWTSLNQHFEKADILPGQGPKFEIEMDFATRRTHLGQTHLQTGFVLSNRELVQVDHPLGRSKRHIEIQLPEGMTYRPGDYMAVLPENPPRNVNRLLERFQLDKDAQAVLRPQENIHTHLPTDFPVYLKDIFSGYVELNQPATKGQIRTLAKHCVCPPEKFKLLGLVKEGTFETEVLEKRVSPLDLLERFAAIDIPLNLFLEMLPPITPRLYSISSSPKWKEGQATLTVSVLNTPAWSGQGDYLGAASNFLAKTRPGDRILVGTQPAPESFHLPDDLMQPVIMVCAGSGIAPFRGFIQERALLKQQGHELGEALLVMGSDHPEVDWLFKEEIQEWEREGAVTMMPAFMHVPDGTVRFVQDRIRDRANEVLRLMDAGAKVFVCGDGKIMAPAVSEAFVEIYQIANSCSPDTAQSWLMNLKKDGFRYAEDVFA